MIFGELMHSVGRCFSEHVFGRLRGSILTQFWIEIQRKIDAEWNIFEGCFLIYFGRVCDRVFVYFL